jgi:hypothetical protein
MNKKSKLKNKIQNLSKMRGVRDEPLSKRPLTATVNSLLGGVEIHEAG